MKLYADSPVRRTRQQVGDLLVLCWVVLCLSLSGAVHRAVLTLAAPGRRMEEAGGALGGRLRDAGTTVADLPLVGDRVRAPLDEAGRAADQLAVAGSSHAPWRRWSSRTPVCPSRPGAERARVPGTESGVRRGMSDNHELRNEESNEAVQAVLDRVLSWQAGAPVETVREELEKGLAEVGESRSPEWLERNAQAISTADPAQS
jgi:hypothetical protein